MKGVIMYAKVYGATLDGMDGVIVTVEVDISQGLPVFDIVGLPNQAVKESRERVRAAIKNSHYEFPMRRIVVNLGPAEVRKSSSGLDLAIAIGILAASGQIKLRKKTLQTLLQTSLFVGELLLDGQTHKTRGILSMALASTEYGLHSIFTSEENIGLLKPIKQLQTYGARDLERFVQILEHRDIYESIDGEIALVEDVYDIDYADVQGQDVGKRAMIISACGFHHLMMVGPPGSGKTMLAERLPTILPSMTWDEQLEVTRIYDVAGLLGESTFIRKRPFRSPHHTSTIISIVGGGTKVKPGEITLAHNGILFLDEAPEFNSIVLDALRQPLESHRISISRYQGTYEYPAKCICIIAANPCPCGYHGDVHKACVCTSTAIHKYKRRLSGPILDRMDLFISMERPTLDDMLGISSNCISSADMKEIVNQGRKAQEIRFKGLSFTHNGLMPHQSIRELCNIQDASWHLIGELFEQFQLTGRSFDRLLKVARTIADIEGCPYVGNEHITEAMMYRYNF